MPLGRTPHGNILKLRMSPFWCPRRWNSALSVLYRFLFRVASLRFLDRRGDLANIKKCVGRRLLCNSAVVLSNLH